mgnify:CR=1 FL=1
MGHFESLYSVGQPYQVKHHDYLRQLPAFHEFVCSHQMPLIIWNHAQVQFCQYHFYRLFSQTSRLLLFKIPKLDVHLR